ncbi:hypothetical protein M378DRAFT_28830 [Amanita muscaria Koide BX008]|uniref:Stalled ribosome sensor GCN1-like N-terminal domain-containing protein n=1 Tax=Amanita muscaria (strain Koide BX008) TaxID=946122 RepID=A0A0C2WD76_AMAMK|nr:hypothetical protein M378DRAFT_28830 [Amanita muscaria Koide BX008]
MSQSEIKSWVSSTVGARGTDDDDEYNDDDEEGRDLSSKGSSGSWGKDLVSKDWSKAIAYARNVLLVGRTKVRIQFLREEILGLVKNGDLDLSQTMDIFKLLTLTYPRYSDSNSRDAVEQVGMELIRHDEGADMKLGVAEQVISWLSVEVGRVVKKGSASSYATADMFVLLSWSCGIYTTCANSDDFVSSNPWKTLINSIAILLDALLGSEAKPSLKKGALVRVRRALRSSGKNVPTVIDSLVNQAKTYPTPLQLVPLIDVAVSVLIRLKHDNQPPEERLPQEQKNGVIVLYTTSLLLSRSSIPYHIMTSLQDFISTFVTPDDLTKTILPTIEKAVLRSPEHALPVATQFFTAYKHRLDTETFRHLVTQVINSSKSSNPIVRSSSVHLFRAVISTIDVSDPNGLYPLATTELHYTQC